METQYNSSYRFEECIDLCKRNFYLFWGIFIIGYIPQKALHVTLDNIVGQKDGSIFFSVISSIIIFIVWALIFIVTNGALVRSVSEELSGNATTIGKAYRYILVKLRPLLSANLLAGFIIGVGCLLLIIPGIILSFLFLFVTQVAVIEKTGGIEALKISKKMAIQFFRLTNVNKEKQIQYLRDLFRKKEVIIFAGIIVVPIILNFIIDRFYSSPILSKVENALLGLLYIPLGEIILTWVYCILKTRKELSNQ